MISLVAAVSENRVIGKNNQLPWRIPSDMKHFREITLHHPVIMGRKTYESMGKPLPMRTNIVVTRDPTYKVEGVKVVHSLSEAIALAKQLEPGEVFIVGGGQIFQEAISIADRLYLTIVHTEVEGDAFFPDYSQFKKVVSSEDKEENSYKFTFVTLEK